ncbi:cell division protein ZapB [Carnimonas bestiolae]|uniref:cell division protein ZapB n=1 Tax=Carnimonas bestiolae TaxID=3402172 RepID=UPI003EDC29E8
MSTELFDQLEQKVSHALETIEMLRLEVEELRDENQKLKGDRDNGASRLNDILARFSQLEQSSSSDTDSDSAPAAGGEHSPSEQHTSQPHHPSHQF